MTKVTHAEQLELDTPANLWAYFGNTGVNKAVFYDAVGKFGIGGAATMGGAVAVPALTIDPNTGLTTLLGGGDLNGQKITSLANGTNPTDAINLSQLTGAIGGSISGTLNRVAKFTAANAVGDTAFPIDDAANALTLGNNQALDVVTVNGRLALTATDGTADSLHATMSATSVTTSSIAAIKGDNASTFDTTASALQSTTACFISASTRSSGANALTNVALTASASGAQDNIALKTELGDVRLNRTGGNARIGATLAASAIEATSTLFAGATPKLEVVTGQAVGTYTELVTVRHTSADVSAVTRRLGLVLKLSDESTAAESNKSGGLVLESTSTFANTPTLSLTTAGSKRVDITAAGNVTVNAPTSGTALAVTGNTTLGSNTATDLTSISGRTTGTSTDSTNNPFNYAMIATSGVNGSRAAIRGDMTGTFDTTVGSLTVYGLWGDASGTRSAGANNLVMVGVRGFASGTADDTRGVLAQTSGTGAIAYGLDAISTGAATSGFGGRFQCTGAGTTNIGVQTTATGAGTNVALKTVSGDVLLNATAGTATIGFNNATNSAVTVKGQTIFTSTQGTGSANSFTWTPVASTISQLAGINITANGTFDTTAGALSTRGLNVSVTSTRSAGANGLTNRAALLTASGAQTNVALSTNDGDVNLNTVSGVTTLGFSTATDAALTVSGRSVLTSTLDTKNAISVTWTPVAGTTSGRGAISGLSNGTFDTTAGANSPFAIFGNTTATKSAGGNSLTNTGVSGQATGGDDNRGLSGAVSGNGTTNYSVFAATTSTGTSNFGITATATGAGTTNIAGNFNASSATTNIAIRTLSGDIYLNQTAGNTGIGVAAGGISATEKLRISSAPSAGTTNFDNTRIAAVGTFDTTAGTLTGRGLIATATSTRSAGANNLTNIAGEFSASGAQINVALQTDSGDVKLNNTAGVATIGFSNATASALTMAGQTGFTSTLSTASANTFTWAPAGGTTGSLSAINIIANGTIDTTAGILNNRGITSTVTTTRSAGANNLQNIAAVLSATGAQYNAALVTNSGDVNLNAVGGSTGVGYTFASALPSKFSVTDATSTASGSTFTWTPVAGTTTGLSAVKAISNGTFDATAGVVANRAIIATNTATRSAGANNVNNIAIDANASGGQTNVALYTQNGDNNLNTLGGNTGVGYAFGTSMVAKLAVTGGSAAKAFDVVSTSTSTAGSAITWTPVAGTTTSLSSLSVNANGTLDTTASGLQTRGISITNTSSRSAGANNLTNYGLIVTATGGQVNNALQTNDGAVILNQASGTTTLGFSTGTASALVLNGASFFSSSLATNHSFQFTWTPVAGTTASMSGVKVLANGTFDTTAGALTEYGAFIQSTATRSAGANALTNVALRLSATSGQANVALQTDDGDVKLNTVSGLTRITGDTYLADGGATKKIAFYGAAGIAQQTVTGSRATGAALADLLTKLAATGIVVDGTTA